MEMGINTSGLSASLSRSSSDLRQVSQELNRFAKRNVHILVPRWPRSDTPNPVSRCSITEPRPTSLHLLPLSSPLGRPPVHPPGLPCSEPSSPPLSAASHLRRSCPMHWSPSSSSLHRTCPRDQMEPRRYQTCRPHLRPPIPSPHNSRPVLDALRRSLSSSACERRARGNRIEEWKPRCLIGQLQSPCRARRGSTPAPSVRP
jgi:hypothetical protein